MISKNQCHHELALHEWTACVREHEARILPWVEAYRKRRERREKHIVHDFLFEYYQCKRRLLAEWHPPVGVILRGAAARYYLRYPQYRENSPGVFLDPGLISAKEEKRIDWIRRLIGAALQRKDHLGCYGLHEWAMIYQSQRIRHPNTPLRLRSDELNQVVETNPIRCTHYDAFRFFTDEARLLNTCQPTEGERMEYEQFGCIHFNMDLLKWCYKLSPWISSELLLDCFFLAVEARELDMRASPYDLEQWGYKPILIETPDGRAAYQSTQKAIAERGRELASRFLEACTTLVQHSSSQLPNNS